MFAAVVGQSWATAAHPFNLEVNGSDLIGSVSYPSIDIEMPGPGSNGSMRFELADPTAAIAISEWDEVRFIEHAAVRPILFGGFVQSVRYVAWAATGRTIVVTCVGYGVLLDKKVVPSDITFSWQTVVPDGIGALVSQYAGAFTATSSGDQFPNLYASGSQFSMAYYYGWTLSAWFAEGATVQGPTTLRSAIDHLLSAGTLGSGAAVGGVYWVDSARWFRLMPDAFDVSAWGPGVSDLRFDSGTGTPVAVTSSTRLTRLEYEREDIDRTTSAYVDGGDEVAGVGWFRGPGLPRAGDLEAIVSEPTVTTATAVERAGQVAVGATATGTARGELSIVATTPQQYWPGRAVTVDAAQVGLAAAQVWRMTSVGIEFANSTTRTYHIGFGGSLPPATAMRKLVRYTNLVARLRPPRFPPLI